MYRHIVSCTVVFIVGFLIVVESACCEDIQSGPHFYSTVKVVCIGVNSYPLLIGQDLRTAELDAVQFGETLKGLFGYEPVYLTGPAATSSAIIATIRELGNSLGADEGLIIYFAGHGVIIEQSSLVLGRRARVREGYLLPYNANVDTRTPDHPNWTKTAIKMHSLVEMLDELNVDHVLLIADSCCSGFLTKRGSAELEETLAKQINLLKERSRTIIAATTQNETAVEGVFTPKLIEILTRYSHGIEAASATDIFSELLGSVASTSGLSMTPQLCHVGEGDGEFIFFPLTIPIEDVVELRREVDRARELQDWNEIRLSQAGKGLVKEILSRGLARSRLAVMSLEFQRQAYGKAVDALPSHLDANSDAVLTFVRRGLGAFKDRDFDGAIALFTKAISAVDTGTIVQVHENAYQMRGRARLLRGEFRRAIDDFSKALTLDDKDAWTYFNRALCYDKIGNQQKAILDSTEAIRIDPTYVDALSNRASTWYALGKHASSLQDYNEALRLRPNHTDALYGRGLTYIELKEFGKARTDFTRAIELRPNYADAFSGLGTCSRSTGLYDQAIREYNQAIDGDSNDPLYFYNRALVWKDKQEYAKAIRDCTTALQLQDYKDADAYYIRGLARYHNDEYIKAVEDFDRALNLEPDFERAFYFRGLTFYEQGKYDAAIRAYTQALKFKDDHADTYLKRGLCWYLLGDYRRSEADSTDAIQRQPNFADAYNNRGLAREDMGHPEKALRDYSLAIKHAPTDERFYLNRGRCLLEKGDSLASLKDFDAAIRLRKDYEKAHFSRGNALFTLGRFKDSITAYTWVTNANGKHAPQAFYNRGVAWERLNQPTKAASDMKKAKQLGFAP